MPETLDTLSGSPLGDLPEFGSPPGDPWGCSTPGSGGLKRRASANRVLSRWRPRIDPRGSDATRRAWTRVAVVVEPERGVEPLTFALQERCSDRLSYSGGPATVALPTRTVRAAQAAEPQGPSPPETARSRTSN